MLKRYTCPYNHGTREASKRVLVLSEHPPPTKPIALMRKYRLREVERLRFYSLRLHSWWHLVQFGKLDPLLQGAAPADGRDVQHAIPELDEGSTGGDGGGRDSGEPERRKKALNSIQPRLDLTGDKNPPTRSHQRNPPLPQAQAWEARLGTRLGGGSPLLGQSQQGHVAEAEVDQVLQQLLPEVALDGLGKGHRALSMEGTVPFPTQDRRHPWTVSLWKSVLG